MITPRRSAVPASAALPQTYAPLLAELKSRVRIAQVRAASAANAELIGLFWHVGSLIARA